MRNNDTSITLNPGDHGFHLTFLNGFVLSVQYGVGNYCDNRDYSSRNYDNHGDLGTTKNFEAAIMDKNGEFCVLPMDVAGWVPIGNLASLIEAVESHDWERCCTLCGDTSFDTSKFPEKQNDGSYALADV